MPLATLAPDRTPIDIFPAEFGLAFCGYEEEAKKASDVTSRHFPTNTIWNTVYLPTIRAALEWKRSRPENAINLLRSAACA